MRDITIRVKGFNATAFTFNMKTLLTAFSSFSYNLDVVILGALNSFRCEAADITMGDGGKFQEFHARHYLQEVTFHVPCAPHGVGEFTV